jgi:hypothetical protein
MEDRILETHVIKWLKSVEYIDGNTDRFEERELTAYMTVRNLFGKNRPNIELLTTNCDILQEYLNAGAHDDFYTAVRNFKQTSEIAKNNFQAFKELLEDKGFITRQAPASPEPAPVPTPEPAPIPEQAPIPEYRPIPRDTPWYNKWYVWVCAAVVVIGVILAVMPHGAGTKDALTKEESITEALNNLEGNYTLREKNGATLVNGIRTAAIKKVSDSQAKILVTSEFGQSYYDFTFTPGGEVQSEQLGNGEIVYKERLGKITITFKQGDNVCEFTK